MRENDLPRVLKWRNHKSIREASGCNKVISPEEHSEWFLNKSIKLMFMHEGKKSGVITLSPDLFWSFYLSPESPKREGLGKKMLTLALNYFQVLGVQTIQAKVRETNEPSIQLHEKLGFKKRYKTKGIITYVRTFNR